MNPQNRYTRPPAKIEPAYSIIHQPANTQHAFVCLNLVPAQQLFALTGVVSGSGRPQLFLVESPLASLFDAKYDWRAGAFDAEPCRRFRDPEKSKQASARPDGYAGSVLRIERAFAVADSGWCSFEFPLVSKAIGYTEALRHWEFCARQPVRPFSRASSQQLSDADVRDILLVAQTEPGISLQELLRIAHEQHGVRIHLRVLKEILSGFRRRQPGIDYVKLCEERNKAIDALEK